MAYWGRYAGNSSVTPPPPAPTTPPPTQATISFANNAANNHIDSYYAGISFEKESMCEPNLWSANNTALVTLLNHLGGTTFRFGANENCTYNPSGTGNNFTIGGVSEVAPSNINQLAHFTAAVGAKMIYDIPLNASNAGIEVQYVNSVMGPSGSIAPGAILFYQFGNEQDLQGSFNSNYWNQWISQQSSAAALVPGAKFGGPSAALPSTGDPNTTNDPTTFSPGWSGPFADMMAGQGRLSYLTHHYYAILNGQGNRPGNSLATWSPDSFLQFWNLTSSAFNQAGPSLSAIVARNGLVDWRMEECNSINIGGDDLYSNSFAAAIWVVDFAFQCAAGGCKGINWHIGNFSPPYSQFDIDYGTGALQYIKPDFYGMLFVSQMLPGRLMDVTVTSGAPANMLSYGLSNDDGSWSVAMQNKDTNPIFVTVTLPSNLSSAYYMTMTDPGGFTAYYTTRATTFGGSSVGIDGSWSPTHTPLTIYGHSVVVTVPAQSSVLVKAR